MPGKVEERETRKTWEAITEQDVLEVIRENYESLFPAERKVADFVLAHVEEAEQSNVSGLARSSGVSDATIIRLARHLGYSGYYQFRLALSRNIGKMLLQEVPDTTAEGQVPQDVIKPVFENYRMIVDAIGRSLNPDLLLSCVSLMRRAGTVHLVAVGNTTSITSYIGFRLERLGIRCTSSLLPEQFLNHISLADGADVVLAVSKSGSSRRVLDAMNLAREKCLRMILITADMQSSAAKIADFVLDSSGGQRLDLEERKKGFSYMNEFVVAETLIRFVANEKGIRKDHAERLEWMLAENKV